MLGQEVGQGHVARIRGADLLQTRPQLAGLAHRLQGVGQHAVRLDTFLHRSGVEIDLKLFEGLGRAGPGGVRRAGQVEGVGGLVGLAASACLKGRSRRRPGPPPGSTRRSDGRSARDRSAAPCAAARRRRTVRGVHRLEHAHEVLSGLAVLVQQVVELAQLHAKHEIRDRRLLAARGGQDLLVNLGRRLPVILLGQTHGDP